MELAKKIVRYIFISAGCFFFFLLILSFTTAPFWMYYGLGAHNQKLTDNPKYIVLLGAGGMPSAENLMRIHTAVEEAKGFPFSKIVIALPGDTTNPQSSVNLMKAEMIEKGITANRIILECIGANTRSQSLEVGKLIPKDQPCLIISSIYHMHRSIGTFKKEGFTNVGSKSAYEIPLEGNLVYNDDELGDSGMMDVSSNTQLRYQFWQHLKYELIVMREYTAITYYKLKGWM
ncbi:MAG: YdcF family protein [Flavobacteriales bacterium]|nr:YdcF family protein [Flavobacteriales bacterium]